MFRQFVVCNVIFMFIIVFLKPSSSADLSPDRKKLYHDIVSGRGLYYGFTKIKELNGTNFKTVVFEKERHKLWLVEFYNSWCGHCHRFAPTWKTLASNAYEWRDTVGIGAVDCANDGNNQLCRDMEVMYYPMIKLFPPKSEITFLGEDFPKGTVEEMLRNVTIKLKTYHTTEEGPEGLHLKPITDGDLASVWSSVPSNSVFLVLVFEPENATVGSELALDLSRTREVQVRLISPNNPGLAHIVGVERGANRVVVLERGNQHTALPLTEHTRVGLNKAVRQFLVDRGVDVPLELPPVEVILPEDINIGDVMSVMQQEDEIKKKLHTTALSSIVFQLDLEGAIRYSLKNEVPLHKNITGERLTALKNYMNILIKYFPFGQQGIDFLRKLNENALEGRSEVSGREFRQNFLRIEEEYKPFLPKQGWIGCQGSNPQYRGYPCSLWTMFHTLTVHEETREGNSTGKQPKVLSTMAGYVKNFFTCSECAGHFTEMAKTMRGNVSTHEDSVIWLWKAHNNVNRRLAGDATEDPKHKKIQFPSTEACPKCRAADDSWNKAEVLTFLRNMYMNIIYLQEEDLSTTTTVATPAEPSVYDRNLRHEVFEEEQGYKHRLLDDNTKRTLWGFNIFDISICVVLYVCSAGILILVCIKFVFKRSYRKKPYIHDILSKV
uniref:Sulfhydryl oxidase n=1 Tax=Graphocephala atropunctata TaxID=36148 RepID=A0A1B6KLZ5_9HEMI